MNNILYIALFLTACFATGAVIGYIIAMKEFDRWIGGRKQ